VSKTYTYTDATLVLHGVEITSAARVTFTETPRLMLAPPTSTDVRVGLPVTWLRAARAVGVAWQLKSTRQARVVRKLREAAEKVALELGRGIPWRVIGPWGERVHTRLLALPNDDRVPVLLATLRELLTDTPDVTEALDRAVVDAERWYTKTQGVQVTDAHRATATAILAAEGDAP
jgi:hypothetical protein